MNVKKGRPPREIDADFHVKILTQLVGEGKTAKELNESAYFLNNVVAAGYCRLESRKAAKRGRPEKVYVLTDEGAEYLTRASTRIVEVEDTAPGA